MSFRKLIWKYRREVGLSLGFIFLANVSGLAVPWGMKLLLDEVLPHKNGALLKLLVLALAMILSAKAVFEYLRRYTGCMLGENMVYDLKEKIFSQLYRLPLGYIREKTPAEILTRFQADTESIRSFLFRDLIDSMYAAISFVLITVLLLWLNAPLTAVAALIFPFLALAYRRLLPKIRQGFSDFKKEAAHLTGRTSEVLHGMAMVRSLNAERYEEKLFGQRKNKILTVLQKNHAYSTALWAGIDFLTSAGVVLILWLGGREVLSGQMTPGALVAFYAYLGMLYAPVIRLAAVNSSYQEARTAAGRINELFTFRQEAGPSLTVSRKPMTGDIRFQDVCFAYNGKEPLLCALNFSIRAGETVGIIGPSGVGKTTLMNLLLRFLQPQEGLITVDGRDIREWDWQEYRQNVSVVLQDDFLFSETIRHNLCYGLAQVSEADIRQILQIVQLEDLVARLPEGLETRIGDRGMRLSAGQRQRIAIARALLRRPAVLILDEATSAVDALTENRIQAGIREFMAGKTVLVVAHRFSSIAHAERVMVLEEGKISAIGGHNYLLNKGGFYSTLYAEQFKDAGQGIPPKVHV